jgi:phosphatidylserine decarboxylase
MKRSAAPYHWRALVALMSRLPQGPLSRAAGRLADIRLPRPLRRPVLGAFAGMAGLDVSEAEFPLADYPSLDAFFVRRLKPGLRPMPDDPGVVVSPVDGQLAELGQIEDGRLLQVKGIRYSVVDLLDDPEEAARYRGGLYVTIYLRPRDYHHIHAPCSGRLDWARHVPGRIFPVNPPAVALVPDLFARNERLICAVDGPVGRLAVVAVAAFNVGRISSEFDPSWNGPRGGVTNRHGIEAATRRYDPPIEIDRCDELMAFHLGSTTVMLIEKGTARLRSDLQPGAPVRLAQPLAIRCANCSQ